MSIERRQLHVFGHRPFVGQETRRSLKKEKEKGGQERDRNYKGEKTKREKGEISGGQGEEGKDKKRGGRKRWALR